MNAMRIDTGNGNGATVVSRGPTRATVSLWACAGLLGLNLLLGLSGVPMVSTAGATGGQPASIDPPFNAAEQRKRMIEQLTMVNDRLARVEAKLEKGLTVKVSEMPAITVNVPAAAEKKE